MAWIEPSDYANPLDILIAREEESELNTDYIESMVSSSRARAKVFEREREGDTSGFSPAELAALNFGKIEIH